MTNDAPELLPCPFCGSKNVQAGHGVRYAECLKCDCMGPTARYPDNAIGAWNTRADDAQAELTAAVAAEREAIAHAICDMEEHDAEQNDWTDGAWLAKRISSAIRARTTADAEAALEAVKREARNEALKEAAIEAEEVAQARLGDERETARACRDHILELMKDTDDE